MIFADLECLFLECKSLETVCLLRGLDAVDTEDETSVREHELRLKVLAIIHLHNQNGSIGPRQLEWLVSEPAPDQLSAFLRIS